MRFAESFCAMALRVAAKATGDSETNREIRPGSFTFQWFFCLLLPAFAVLSIQDTPADISTDGFLI